jgi:hypothetical protein
VLAFDYGNGASVRIREGPLGDGLGARVWAIAHALCRELAGAPAAVAGLDVLEIGAGTGLCGIVAAKLGARRVVRTGGRWERAASRIPGAARRSYRLFVGPATKGLCSAGTAAASKGAETRACRPNAAARRASGRPC